CKYCGPDGPGTRIENRDNKPLKHLIDPIKCPLAPQSARNAARTYLASKASEPLPDPIGGSMASVPETVSLEDDPDATNVVVQHPSKVLKRPSGTLLGYVDPALTAGQQERANVKLFRFIVHANIPLSAIENWFFRNFLDEIRPSYTPPSRYVL
ncbi:hypothetical protein EV363DRAFT_1148590, partial [Boletus edulis]